MDQRAWGGLLKWVFIFWCAKWILNRRSATLRSLRYGPKEACSVIETAKKWRRSHLAHKLLCFPLRAQQIRTCDGPNELWLARTQDPTPATWGRNTPIRARAASYYSYDMTANNPTFSCWVLQLCYYLYWFIKLEHCCVVYRDHNEYALSGVLTPT